MRIYLIIILLISLFGCQSKKKSKISRKIDHNTGAISEGELIDDSLFNGPVKYYDSLNNYLGFITFKYGKKEGVEINHYPDGHLMDSIIFKNDMLNGFSYHFSDNGKLTYKTFYLNDKHFGHCFVYDSAGKVTNYFFTNFEGNIIYKSFRKDSDEYTKGSPIQANVYSESNDSADVNKIFVYLFLFPFSKRHYEIGLVDSSNKIITSEPIISSDCYYTQEIPPLKNKMKYAIILHTYNAFKKRDDLAIRVIE